MYSQITTKKSFFVFILGALFSSAPNVMAQTERLRPLLRTTVYAGGRTATWPTNLPPTFKVGDQLIWSVKPLGANNNVQIKPVGSPNSAYSTSINVTLGPNRKPKVMLRSLGSGPFMMVLRNPGNSKVITRRRHAFFSLKRLQEKLQPDNDIPSRLKKHTALLHLNKKQATVRGFRGVLSRDVRNGYSLYVATEPADDIVRLKIFTDLYAPTRGSMPKYHWGVFTPDHQKIPNIGSSRILPDGSAEVKFKSQGHKYYDIEVGFDYDADGKIESQEYSVSSPQLQTILITTKDTAIAHGEIAGLVTNGGYFNFPLATFLLSIFEYGAPNPLFYPYNNYSPSSNMNSELTVSSEKLWAKDTDLTHVAGAKFVNGVATIPKLVFSPTSIFSRSIGDSNAYEAYIRKHIKYVQNFVANPLNQMPAAGIYTYTVGKNTPNVAAKTQDLNSIDFATNAGLTGNYGPNFTVDPSSISHYQGDPLHFWDDLDLTFAIKKAAVENATVRANYTTDENGDIKVRLVDFYGDVTDLFDFEYETPWVPAPTAATLQIGWRPNAKNPTRRAGRIFKSHFRLALRSNTDNWAVWPYGG